MINAIINNKDKTAVVEFPMDLYKLYRDLHEIGFQGGPHRVKLTDNEEDDIRVKLFSDNDFGNHLVLLFNENDTLEDVHTVMGIVPVRVAIQQVLNRPTNKTAIQDQMEIWYGFRKREANTIVMRAVVI